MCPYMPLIEVMSASVHWTISNHCDSAAVHSCVWERDSYHPHIHSLGQPLLGTCICALCPEMVHKFMA